MKFLIVGLVKNEQILRLQDEAKKRGHVVDGCNSFDLVLDFNPNSHRHSERSEESPFNYYLEGLDINSYDVIYLCVVGNRRWDWYLAMQDLSKKGVKIVNIKVVDTSYNLLYTAGADYKKQLETEIPFPRSTVFFHHKSIPKILQNYTFPLILKVSSEGKMRKGRGVFLIKDVTELKRIVKENYKEAHRLTLREFIPNDGDIRIFTVGYKAIGAMKRTAKEGDFRSNISQGGTGEEFDLNKNPKVKEIAEQVSSLTRTEIAGVDIMLHKETGDPYVLEVNFGPQFLGLEQYTRTNAALEIIKYFESLIDNKN